jgi:molybdopterin synthase catalytic subunit
MQETVRVAAVTDGPLSVDRLLSAVNDRGVGGIALFIGTVRDHDPDSSAPGGEVTALDYTAHPSAPERLLACAERAARLDGIRAVAVEHRTGHLEVGDLAVVVAVGAAHRAEAFTGCRQLIDELKVEVPIWKEQTDAQGSTEWIGLP